MNKKTFWLILFILALGTWLRLIFIDKPDGLWNDEYVSWYIASIPYGKTFWQAVFAQCHMPFYYFYLKFFMHFFGNSDLMLRLTSVFSGFLSIISMYFVGKEFKNNNLGILCASQVAISSFLIYFSQEVRFYSLLFLFASLVLLFTLKLLKEPKLSNIIFFIIFNLLVIFTHTIGFVYIFINLLFVTIYLCHAEFISASYKHIMLDRFRNKFGMTIILWISLFILSLIGLPLLLKILTSHSQSQWWGHFSISKIGFLITDYFSPILTNIVSAPDNFFYNFSFIFVIFALIPSIIAIIAIIKALMTKEYKILGLFYVSLAYILILVLAAISGKLVFITKYSIEIYPILILLMGFGLLEFKKNWRYSLIFLYCFLNLFYILANPISAPKLHRPEGHKIVAELMKNANLQDGDFILLNYYPQERFEKYFNFSKYKVISINKGNFSQYLGINSKDDFQKINDTYFENKINNEILNGLKHNQKISIVVLNSVSGYLPIQIQEIASNDKTFNKTPYLFLIFSYIKNETLKECLKKLSIQRIEQKGSWSVITFIKQ